MGSAHEDQGRCQIVVMSLDEFFVIIPSHLAVALVELSPMSLLVSGQAGLFFASRKSQQTFCRTQKNSLVRLFFIAFFPTPFLPPIFFEALAEIKG